ncbi:PREDICTED: LOW QUALITY PROTEIN: mesoderm posterior protein 2, partial [Miniopterus natalensis]|uniref:LOW QUALITY PROTEIN: mesoderm posterior protein 2 n=1 Tax=Miniopterus natalensis TaxID=291302 RepID=UPI0007A6C2DE
HASATFDLLITSGSGGFIWELPELMSSPGSRATRSPAGVRTSHLRGLCFDKCLSQWLLPPCPACQSVRLGNEAWGQPCWAELISSLLQGISVSPESYLLPETPPLLPGPACQRLQPQTQWGYWNHSAEVLPSSEDQGPGPTFHFNDEGPLQSSGLQLGGCPELWQEDLEGGHLSIF